MQTCFVSCSDLALLFFVCILEPFSISWGSIVFLFLSFFVSPILSCYLTFLSISVTFCGIDSFFCTIWTSHLIFATHFSHSIYLCSHLVFWIKWQARWIKMCESSNGSVTLCKHFFSITAYCFVSSAVNIPLGLLVWHRQKLWTCCLNAVGERKWLLILP